MTASEVPLEIAPPVINGGLIEMNWTYLGPGYLYSLEHAPLDSTAFTAVPPFTFPSEDNSYSGPLVGEGGTFRIRTIEAGP
jgi:hypothetical protein